MLYPLLKPLLFSLDPELAHETIFNALKAMQSFGPVESALADFFSCHAPELETKVFGLSFKNPVGLAAGFDKNCEALRILAAFGFGFIECGTVTAKAQPGNPKPRLFRLKKEEALINRMGFNNVGAEAVSRHLKAFRLPEVPVGVNIGKSKVTELEKAVEDYLFSFEKLYPFASYFTLNVSSPNTPRLRELQKNLDPLLSAIQAKNADRKPLLVKIAPDLEESDLSDVVEACLRHRVAGIIATNTTISRDGVRLDAPIEGGLSGKPLEAKATAVLRSLYKKVKGKMDLIGVGGISSAEDALRKIQSGASLVQIYTAWVYRGPGLISTVNRGLASLLKKEGFKNISEAVGVSA